MESSTPVFHQELVLVNIKRTYEKYVNLLSPIFEVQVGDKLAWFGEDNNLQIYINKPTYFTSFYRWYYKQGREQTLFNIATIKQNYAKFLDDIYYGCSTSYMYMKFNEIANNAIELNERLLPVFFNLKETYKENNKIVSVLDKFIHIMREFKTNIFNIRETVKRYPPNHFFK